ncbi:MAG: thioesterase family protein [Planctomycetota bacterium]|nr:thioesterase family protein [Planctomycetota bacterium]
MNEHTTTIRVRFGETDKMGVVYHPNYLIYFEIGRTEMLRKAGLIYSELEENGGALVVVEAGVQYRKSVRYDEEIRITTRATRIGHASMNFDYLVRNQQDAIVAEGFTKLGCVGENLKPKKLPPEVKKCLSPP